SDATEARDLTADDFVEYYNTGANSKQPFGNDEDWKAGLTITSGSTLYQNGEAIADAKTHLAGSNVIGAFKHYANGQTYYFVKIQHNPEYKETEYAVIRNHKYVVNISGITGLGTPVPNPNDDDPEAPTDPTPTPGTDPDPEPDPTPDSDPTAPDQPLDPETPTDDHSALDAQILIMKYRVVSQDVTLDNQK
ncbi:MAG: fimbria major subunit, partial [Bacteroidaceae bacterium]|nr:fimbria major subunit [Bacteroidaceae bacterium]